MSPFMNRTLAAVLAALTLCFAAGCATTTTPVAPQAASAACEEHELAPGVALCIQHSASPGARDAAERVMAEYRENYLNAR